MASSVGAQGTVWGARVSTIAALEHELARLRRRSSAHAREQVRSVARATVLTLVVYAEREAHADRAADTIARLAQRHPSRAIIVLGDRTREGTDVAVELHCHVPPAGDATQVCYEQIMVRMQGDADERIASVVIPLLVPDLPVFLWWTGTPPRDARRFDRLLALADRFIVDSSDFARPERTLPFIASLARDEDFRSFAITDLNWTRLTPWRELIAAFFDVAAWRPYLDRVVGIRVGFGVDMDGRVIHPSQALLLVGWLASRLGWLAAERLAPSEAGGMLFAMRRPDGAAVEVRVRPRFERGVEPGDTSGVRIQARSGSDLVEFVLKRSPDPHHVTASVLVNGERRSLRVVPLPSAAMEELIREELSILGTDAIYEEALHALVALA